MHYGWYLMNSSYKITNVIKAQALNYVMAASGCCCCLVVVASVGAIKFLITNVNGPFRELT